MTEDPLPQPKQRITFLWCMVAGILIALSLWPLWSGMVVINDDLKFVRSPACDLPVGDHLRQMWASQSFRPLEVLVGRTCDAETLRCTLVIPIQAIGFAMICWAVSMLARIILPTDHRLAPLAMILVALSPATTTALWQMDTCSQTWGVAFGLWSCVIAWHGFREAESGRWPWVHGLLLAGGFVVSGLIKETAYGWSFSIGLCALWGTAVLLRQSRTAPLRMLPILLGLVAIPLLLLIVRLGAGALGHEQGDALDNPYKLDIGLNLPMNALMVTIGAAATGPFHLITNGDAPLVLRALPGLACVLVGLLGVTAFEFGFLRGGREERSACRLAVLLILRACDAEQCVRAVGVAARLAFAMTLAIGAFGLCGRAAHFRTTWMTASRTNAAIIQAADAWVAKEAARGTTLAPGDQLDICFGPACRPGSTYGQYICSVLQAIDWNLSARWMLRRDPKLRLGVRTDLDCTLFPGTVFTVDCPANLSYGKW